MICMAIYRHKRLRPASSTGRQAKGASASEKPGYARPRRTTPCTPWRSREEAKMIDVEALHQHGVLGRHHVVIVVLREVHAQTVGRFARFAVPDVVRKNEVEL